MTNPEVFNLFPELEESYGMSRAWKVSDMIYMSGFTAFNDAGEIVGVNDMSLQFRQIYRNMSATLNHFGAKLHHVVEQTVYVTDIGRIGEGIDVVKELWGTNPFPAAVGVEVQSLALPEMLVEIKASAHAYGDVSGI